MLSMISSISPPVFDVRDGVAPIPKDGREPPDDPPSVRLEVFADVHMTLPEVLRENGCTTAGISTNGHLIERQGFAQGFDSFNERDCMWGTAECALTKVLE